VIIRPSGGIPCKEPSINRAGSLKHTIKSLTFPFFDDKIHNIPRKYNNNTRNFVESYHGLPFLAYWL